MVNEALTRAGVRRRAWAFARLWRGEYLDRNGTLGVNESGAQCVNVPNTWLEELGHGAIIGNAGSWIGRAEGGTVWQTLNHGSRPRVGDVWVLTGWPAGPEGHTGIVLDGSHEIVTVLEQNAPEGAPVQVGRYNVAEFDGWLHVLRG